MRHSFAYQGGETAKWFRTQSTGLAGMSTIQLHRSILRVFLKPIPLSFLCLGTFDSHPETRKEKAEDGGLLDSFRHQHISIYPFTIYHGASKLGRRYTLYANSEAVRKKWQVALVDALGVHRVRQEANMVG